MRGLSLIVISLILSGSRHSYAQVDTTFIYNPSTSFGVLDLRLSKSAQQHYYLRENQTFSYRATNGVRTNGYLDMTAWDSKAYTEGNLREVVNGVDAFVMNYRLLKPANYSNTVEKGYPLVIVLHGLLERGNCAENKCYHGTSKYSPNVNVPPAGVSADQELLNNDYNLVHGGLNYLEASLVNGNSLPDNPNLPPRGYPGFVVFPQNLNGWDDASVEDAIRIVRLLTRKYNIDEDRIYINGISHGGHGAYKAMARAPWLFAAGILFSAADDAGIITQGLTSKIAGIPLWLFQGGKDLKPTRATTERYVQHFRNKGASVRYTLYPELGHGTWNKAFSEPDFFTWMLRHKRNEIHVYADNPVICSTSREGTLMTLPEGYAAYEWEHNGIIVGFQSNFIARGVGTYRARFLKQVKEMNVWSEWSDNVDVKIKDPGVAAVKVNGTRFLPDPNGNDTISFEGVNKNEIYYWYKDNSKLSFHDTTRNVAITSVLGDGKYYLKASDYDGCATLPSTPEQVYFSDGAPNSIDPPSSLEVTSISPSETQVKWSDNSRNETGFEIWRRRESSSGKFENWKLAGIAAGNTSTFGDKQLRPASRYEYQIRAIAESSRSVYTPSSTASSISVITLNDTQKPSAPELISAEQTGVESISLLWIGSSDNSSIQKYFVIINDDTLSTTSSDTTLLLNEIRINTNYSFQIVAVDAGNNLSEPSNERNVYSAVEGLFYQHSTGAWESLKDIDWSLVEFTGKVRGFTLSPRTQQDFFNFRFDGFLRIAKEGVYQFRISSDDGSSLSLNDSVLVTNDGIHALTTTTSPIQLLASGPHRIQVDFFDYERSDSLVVEYKGPDSNNEWISIPEEAFKSSLITEVETEVSTEMAASVYPNPTTHDNINVVIPDQMGNAVISLSNTTGQVLSRMEVLDGAFESGYKIPQLDSLPPGLYFITIQQKKLVSTVRLIVK